MKALVDALIRSRAVFDLKELRHEFTKEVLQYMYEDQEGCLSHIAALLGIKRPMCTHLLVRYGIHQAKKRTSKTKMFTCPRCKKLMRGKVEETETPGHRCLPKET